MWLWRCVRFATPNDALAVQAEKNWCHILHIHAHRVSSDGADSKSWRFDNTPQQATCTFKIIVLFVTQAVCTVGTLFPRPASSVLNQYYQGACWAGLVFYSPRADTRQTTRTGAWPFRVVWRSRELREMGSSWIMTDDRYSNPTQIGNSIHSCSIQI